MIPRVSRNAEARRGAALDGRSHRQDGSRHRRVFGAGRGHRARARRARARVVLGVRDLQAGARVARGIRDSIEGCPADRVLVPTTPSPLIERLRGGVRARVSSTHAPVLDVLVNNAGVNFLPKSFTPEGIGTIAQINFLGPAALTRLLEEPLRRAAARRRSVVAHVSRASTRYGRHRAGRPRVPAHLGARLVRGVQARERGVRERVPTAWGRPDVGDSRERRASRTMRNAR